ncbi:MAG: ATP-dependent RNA helicase HrpA [Acidiferrobacterales bacterium]
MKRAASQQADLAAGINGLQEEVGEAMLIDRRRFRRQLSRLRARTERGSPDDSLSLAFQHLQREIRQSVERHTHRRLHRPIPTFPDPLPVVERREEIARAIVEHPIVVICGETGSGKTTQLPKICLELERGVSGLIGHTQPRRIAARSVAERVAQELTTDVGGAVGYKVRFHDRLGPSTYIKIMTDGILLAETQSDRFLEQYDTLIIDEAHERSLNIDFLLGYLRTLISKRKDLKLIITSATIDPDRFSQHFSNAPIIEVSGRVYPVEVRYRPLEDSNEDDRDCVLQEAILDAVDELSAIDRGDILVFLSGEREIRETAEALRKHHPPNTEVLPLYARLSALEQSKVFQRHSKRRIVLATNVAETSLTVPGIRYVIDSGYARIGRYSHRTKVQRLPIERISRASADQRKGRCGRMSAGICVRLYSEEDYAERPEFTEPEVRRTNLAGVVLQMKALGLEDVQRFPFIDGPDPRLIKDGFKLLTELGALDTDERLTPIGHQLARLPVDPRIGRMILAARNESCLNEVLIIASALSVQDPRDRPLAAAQKADERHRQFLDERSDFLTFLNLWDAFHDQVRHLSKNKLRAFCRQNFLSYVRMQNWHDTHRQLCSLVKGVGFRVNQAPARYPNIHRALLTGLLGSIGFKRGNGEYLGARGTRFSIFPGSALFKKNPKWIMAAELVETARVYAHTVAAIEPEWIEEISGSLCRRTYLEPYWDRTQAAVVAYEQVTLYGLVIVSGRRVNYGSMDPAAARTIFIRHALVHGNYDGSPAFLKHNRELLGEIEELEHKSRRRDILVDEDQVFQFYDRSVPPDLCDGLSFERWYQQTQQQNPRLLFVTREELVRHGAAGVTAEHFPDQLNVDGMDFGLDYHFEPGYSADGVTMTVPVAALNQLNPSRFEWLVPGLLREKLVALIKSLPKSLRRHFVPASHFADACLQAVSPCDQRVTAVLGEHLARMTGVTIPNEAWRSESLPPHLRMNFRLVDTRSRVIAMGRDLEELQRDHGEHACKRFAEISSMQFEKENITRWNFGDLPERVALRRDGQSVQAFPALVDKGLTVSLKLFDTPHKAEQVMRGGLRRLFILRMPQQIKYLQKNLSGIQQMCLHYASLGGCTELKEDLVNATVDRVFVGDEVWVRNGQEFDKREQEGKQQLLSTANTLCELVSTTLAHYHAVHSRLGGATPSSWEHAISDMQNQLERLVYKGFVSRTPYRWLLQLPRYLQAMLMRFERLEQGPAKDRNKQSQIMPLWQAYLTRSEACRWTDKESQVLEDYRWWLEELRVSLFAQELKTAFPVSVRRLQDKWKEIVAS